jgi:hypothetical protein
MEGFGVDRLSTQDVTAQRISLFIVGSSVACFFAFLGWILLALATCDTDPGSRDEVKWSGLAYPPLAIPWAIAGWGVGIMVWAVFGRWSGAEETARGEPARESAPESSGVPSASPDWGWLRRRSVWLVVLAAILVLMAMLAG